MLFISPVKIKLGPSCTGGINLFLTRVNWRHLVEERREGRGWDVVQMARPDLGNKKKKNLLSIRCIYLFLL